MKMTVNGMEHTPATTMVFQTTDYNRFRMIKGNRGLDVNKIKKILGDIDRGTNLLKYVPVLVVEHEGKLDIIDGQHRFSVSKKKKEPVYYIIAESLSLYDIARMNSNQEKWKPADFTNSQIEHEQKVKRTRSGAPLFKTKVVDLSRLHEVRIDRKTCIYIKPGECPVEAKYRYIKKLKEHKSRMQFNEEE